MTKERTNFLFLGVILPIAILLFGIVSVVVSWKFVKDRFVAQSRTELVSRAKDMTGVIYENLKDFSGIVRSARAFFSASKSVERDEWYKYSNQLGVLENYPESVSISYSEIVKDDQLPGWLEAVRSDTSTDPMGYPYAELHPVGAKKQEYILVKYVEPAVSRTSTIGFDLSSDSARAIILASARDTGDIAMGPIVNLSSTNRPGFNFYAAIYDNNLPATNENQRRKAIVGFAGVNIRLDEFFQNVIRNNDILRSHLYWDVFDSTGVAKSGGKFIYAYSGDEKSIDASDEALTDVAVEIGGRRWTFNFYLPNAVVLSVSQNILLWLILLGGIVFSVMMALTVFSLAYSSHRARRLAGKLTMDLKKSETISNAVISSVRDAIVMTDENDKIVLWNAGAEKIIGYRSEEVVGKSLHDLIPFEANDRSNKESLNDFERTGESKVIDKTWAMSIRAKDGSKLLVELTVTRAYINDAWYAVGVMRDITESSQSSQIIEQRSRDLEKMNQLMVGRELKMRDLKKQIEDLKKSG